MANNNNTNKEEEDDPLPTRVTILPEWGEQLVVPEWEHKGCYRATNGWKGHDLVHRPDAPVRIDDYFVVYGPGDDLPQHLNNNKGGGAGTTLTGVCEFTPFSESHKNYCHGGSMCSVMDDVVGWIAFCCTGQVLPWSAFTVQVNTKLCKPIRVGSRLILQATIVSLERRKVISTARLYDQQHNTYATCDGIAILNRGILSSPESTDSLVKDDVAKS